MKKNELCKSCSNIKYGFLGNLTCKITKTEPDVHENCPDYKGRFDGRSHPNYIQPDKTISNLIPAKIVQILIVIYTLARVVLIVLYSNSMDYFWRK